MQKPTKIHEREMYDLVYDIFYKIKEHHADKIPHDTSLVIKATTARLDGQARCIAHGGAIHNRIYIMRHSLSTPKIYVTHLILHEICHFLVGFQQKHNSVFLEKEKELNKEYGINIKAYTMKTPEGNFGYARLNDLEWILEMTK